ncbi:hypothetical protein Pcac1_g23403 [Phytophthora cactorum]|uniref:Uncharacterized protein n=1 Tax=Phytophthora cactorum TaxID=29920 RepID=A0A329SV86_9STRA|nr:hypothetical protein Pcac1_g23403 [Phytophthora cactorum]RAW39738.1 hypothetical protein PC110_g4032 [Phytophthora cactorum]
MAPLESKFDKKQTILHTNASLTPNSVTDRVAAKMIEHLTHHFHRHICSNNGPLGQAEKDVLNIEECDVWRCLSWTGTLCTYMEDTPRQRGRGGHRDLPPHEGAGQADAAVPYVLKQYIVLQAGLAFHDKDEEGRTSQGGRSS